MTSEWVLTVDLGTTSTVVASASGTGSASVLEVDGARGVPSTVFVAESGEVVVGPLALEMADRDPARAVRTLKRQLGESAPLVVGGRAFTVDELVTALLRHVLDAAVRRHGETPAEVRLTHPANWSPPRQAALRRAALAAGMPYPVLVPEPVAAASYVAGDLHPGQHAVVYDLGGGTFDAAVVEATPDGFDVTGRPGGDDRIGGDLLDELVAGELGEQLDPGTWEQLHSSDDPQWRRAAAGLRMEARRVREALSSEDAADAMIGLPTSMVERRLSRADLEVVLRPPLEQTVALVRDAVTMAGLTPDRIDGVCLVGGASRTPLVERLVRSAFPSAALLRSGDPAQAVALGAARGAPVREVEAASESRASGVAVAEPARDADDVRPERAARTHRPRLAWIVAAAVVVIALVAAGVVLVDVLGGGSGGGNASSDGSRADTRADQQLADAALLTVDDLPDGYEPNPDTDSGESPTDRCFTGLAQDAIDVDAPTARSNFALEEPTIFVDAFVKIFPSVELARARFAAITNDDTLDCLAEEFLAVLDDDGATTAVGTAPDVQSRLGDERGGFRVEVALSDGFEFVNEEYAVTVGRALVIVGIVQPASLPVSEGDANGYLELMLERLEQAGFAG